MRIHDLLLDVSARAGIDATVHAPGLTAPGEIDITDVANDSRSAAPGCLYCAVPGAAADGHDFAADAVATGAVAVLSERILEVAVPQLIVADTRQAMPWFAAAVAGHPSASLQVVGVTGTNGKSTTTHLLRAVFQAAGRRTTLLGNLLSGDVGADGRRPPNTPEAPELQATLAGSLAAGDEVVAMEVSSHALDRRRVDGITFAAAVFTNLTPDHLDFHGDMESYFAAKARLFEPGRAGVAVVNTDDPYGRRLLESARTSGVPVRPFSLDDAKALQLQRGFSTFVWRGVEVRIALPGRHNVMNALAAAETGLALGLEPAVVAAGLASAEVPPGRFEPVEEGQPFDVVVDYAHTPDGLEQVLRTAAEVSGRAPVVVFGCGGDKDRSKRPMMGAVAARLAGVIVLTSDNPRSEDPLAIIEEISAGMPQPDTAVVEPDRSKAIAIALAAATPGDIVVIAGKGHETGQTARGATVPFDDREVARRHLQELIQ